MNFKRFFILFTVLTLFINSSILCEDNTGVEELLTQGKTKFDQKNYAGAIRDFSEVIGIDSYNVDAYYNRAICRMALQDYKGAIEGFSKIIEIIDNPKAAEMIKIEDLNVIRELKNSSLYARAECKSLIGDHRGANQDYSKYIEENPNHAWALLRRGKERRILMDLTGALQDYKAFINLYEKEALELAKIDAGELEKKPEKNKDQLIRSLENKLNVDLFLKALFKKGEIEYKLKNYKNTIQDLTRIIEFGDSGYNDVLIDDTKSSFGEDTYFLRGWAKFYLKDYAGAKKDAAAVIDLNPNNAEAFYLRGLSKINLSDKDKGCLDLSRALELGSNRANDAIKKFCR